MLENLYKTQKQSLVGRRSAEHMKYSDRYSLLMS